MKNIVKIIIALFFILGAFFIGKYHDSEENKSVINELNKNRTISEKQIKENENQIKMMSVEIATLKDSVSKILEKQGITKAIRNAGSAKSKENASKESK